MILAASLPTQPNEQLDAALERIAAAGFAAVSLVSDDAPNHDRSAPATWLPEFKRRSDEHGLHIASWFALDAPPLAAADPDERRRAHDHIVALIQRAAENTIPAFILRPADLSGEQPPSYVDALAWTFEALDALRHEAETVGVAVVVDHRGSRFLLSPAEAADLLDTVNSPAVGWQLDCDPVGRLSDWIATMARHLMSVRLGAVRPDAARRELIQRLRQAGYSGPLVLESPEQIAAWQSAVGSRAS